MLWKFIVQIRSVGSRIPCLHHASFLLFVLRVFLPLRACVSCVQICGRAVVDDYLFRTSTRTLLTIGLRAVGRRLRLWGWRLIARTSMLLITVLFSLLRMNMPVIFLDPLKTGGWDKRIDRWIAMDSHMTDRRRDGMDLHVRRTSILSCERFLLYGLHLFVS